MGPHARTHADRQTDRQTDQRQTESDVPPPPHDQVCAKINHNVRFEGSVAQRKEIMLQAMMKHSNVVAIMDVLKEVQ